MKRCAIAAQALLLATAGCATATGGGPPRSAATGGSTPRSTGYVEANGVNTYYERSGNGPPLVLVHGAAMVAEGWNHQVEALARHFTVYVPERRGMGRTADIEGDWSYAGMAVDTAAFLDALKIKSAAVVGLSDGGNIGLILAYTRPDLVRQLVISGANLNPAGLGEFKDAVAAMTPEQLLAGAPPEVAPWLEIHRRVSPDRGQGLLASFAKMMRMWLNFEIAPADLARISAATLVMGGDQDIIPVVHTVEIWSAVPGAKLCIAPNAGHFWLMDNPKLANEIILAFLQTPPAAKAP